MSEDEQKVVTFKMKMKHWKEMEEFASDYGLDVSALIRLATLRYIRDERNKERKP